MLRHSLFAYMFAAIASVSLLGCQDLLPTARVTQIIGSTGQVESLKLGFTVLATKASVESPSDVVLDLSIASNSDSGVRWDDSSSYEFFIVAKKQELENISPERPYSSTNGTFLKAQRLGNSLRIYLPRTELTRLGLSMDKPSLEILVKVGNEWGQAFVADMIPLLITP